MSTADEGKKPAPKGKATPAKREEKPGEPQQPNEEDIAKVIQDSPPEIRRVLSRFFSMSISSHQETGPFSSKFFDSMGEKLNEKHISEILQSADRSDKRSFWHSIFSRVLYFVAGLVGAGLFVWITIFLAKDNKDLYFEIIKIAAIALGGFGAGYGAKSYRSRK